MIRAKAWGLLSQARNGKERGTERGLLSVENLQLAATAPSMDELNIELGSNSNRPTNAVLLLRCDDETLINYVTVMTSNVFAHNDVRCLISPQK